MENFRGIWISAEILLNKELAPNEKLVLAMVMSFNKDEGSCFMSNQYIGKILNVSKDMASRIVSSLKKNGFIDIEYKYKENSKEIESRFLTPTGKITNTYGREYQYPIGENNMGGSSNQQYPIGRKGKDINNSNIININNHIKRDYEEKDFEKFYVNVYANGTLGKSKCYE